MEVTSTPADTKTAQPLYLVKPNNIKSESYLGGIVRSPDEKINISPPAIYKMEAHIELNSAMRRIEAENNPGSPKGTAILQLESYSNPVGYLETLAKAYDQSQAGLNENSANSNKHGNFLNDVFKDMVNSFVEKNETANQQIKMNVFSDVFLKNYEKLGMEAFGIAMQAAWIKV
jgi:hypothetical protein